MIRTPGIRGLHFSPPYKKIASSQFSCRCENNIFNPRAEKLRVHDTSAAHSAIYKELGMEKYGSELVRMDGKQDDARKARRKSDVLVDN